MKLRNFKNICIVISYSFHSYMLKKERVDDDFQLYVLWNSRLLLLLLLTFFKKTKREWGLSSRTIPIPCIYIHYIQFGEIWNEKNELDFSSVYHHHPCHSKSKLFYIHLFETIEIIGKTLHFLQCFLLFELNLLYLIYFYGNNKGLLI